MENSPSSSFIPKQTPKPVAKKSASKGRRFNIFTFLGSTILIAALLLAAGTFVYRNQVDRALVEAKNQLGEERNRFSEADIALVKEIDRKIKAVEYRINEHVATSKIFDALELNTNQNVQFTSMQITKRPNQGVILALSGMTRNFGTVALQEMVFGNQDIFDDAFFAGVTNNLIVPEFDEETNQTVLPESDIEEDFVQFNIEANISSDLISYDGPIQGSSFLPTDEEYIEPGFEFEDDFEAFDEGLEEGLEEDIVANPSEE